MLKVRRRELLAGVAAFMAAGVAGSRAQIVTGLPWRPDEAFPPVSAALGPWLFFTGSESAMMEALVDRLIPPDPQTPGGRDAGCAVYIDRQLAGPYGSRRGLYVGGPFIKGAPNQGPQSADNPAQEYRKALAALDAYARSNKGDAFAKLAPDIQDQLLEGLEKGEVKLEGLDGGSFFKTLLKDTQEGFFADPLYGGNRDMCGWKMIGFPGARYDYRDWVGRHNERYPHPPVSIVGRADWTPTKS